MRRNLLTLGLLAVAGTVAAFAQELPPDAPPPPRKGLRIDIGRFTPSGRSLVIEVGEREHGDGVRVDVESHSPEGSKGVHVDVDTGAARHGRGGAVDVQVGRTRGGVEPATFVPALETFLGVSSEPIAPALAEQLADLLPERAGLLVTHVQPESSADEAGLRRHDVLTAYAGTPLSTPVQLKELVTRDRAGDRIELTVVRGGRERILEAVLHEREIAAPAVDALQPVLGEAQPGPALSIESTPDLPVPQRTLRPDFEIPAAPGGDQPGPEVLAPLPRAEPASELETRPQVLPLPPHENGVSVSTPDGRFFQVEIRYVDRIGQPQLLLFEGTKSEIRRQMDAAPPELKVDVKRSLERAGA